MGDLRPDNPPDDGSGQSRRGLPDLPPEWGTVIIPDDASALDAEAEQVRRELRGQRRHERLGGALGRLVGSSSKEQSLSVPVVVIAVALVTTLASLFLVTVGRQPTSPLPPVSPVSPPAAPGPSTEIADVVLVDASGVQIRLGSLLPAVVLLVDGCECAPLVIDTALAAPEGVRVIPVATTAPLIYGAPVNVRALADAEGILRTKYGGAPTAAQTQVPPGSPPAGEDQASPVTALLVNGAGEITGTVTPVDTADDLAVAFDGLSQ